MRKHYFYIFLGCLVLVLTTASAYWQKNAWEQTQAKKGAHHQLRCLDLESGCQLHHIHTNTHYVIRTIGQPSPLVRFKVRLTPLEKFEATNKKVKVTARFRMDGMDMGEQPILLQWNDKEKSWEKETILPVCVASRHDWILNLTIDENYESDISFTTRDH